MYKNYTKRILDITASLIILPIFAVIYTLVAVMVKLDDTGPVLYSGERIGKNFKKYKMYKFRTMIVNAPDIRNEDGSTFNSSSDKRLTRVGKVLRKLSIDEIPQIINILKGDMSLIGPRPSPIGNEKLYSQEYLEKFAVRPGVTGYAQAFYRNDATIEEKQKSDLYYVKHVSLILDVKILLRTIVTVIKREGLYTNGSSNSTTNNNDGNFKVDI